MSKVIQNFKIEEEAKKLFNEICKQNHTDASHELRQFVFNYLKKNQNKSISINQYLTRPR